MFRRVRVAGHSMAPTLRDGEKLLVNTWAYRNDAPRVGDLVVAWHPDGRRKIVKRVVTAPEGIPVPPTRVYVRGDNPIETTDSDAYGPIERSRVLGKVWFSTTNWRRVR